MNGIPVDVFDDAKDMIWLIVHVRHTRVENLNGHEVAYGVHQVHMNGPGAAAWAFGCVKC